MKKQDLREAMPETAKMIDAMRAALGVDDVNAILKRSMKGEPGCFYAVENGIRFGTPDLRSRWLLMWDARGRGYSIESDWMFVARCIANSRGITLPRMTEQNFGGDKVFDKIERDNHAIAAQAREIYLSATDDEMYLATTIKRDDIK